MHRLTLLLMLAFALAVSVRAQVATDRNITELFSQAYARLHDNPAEAARLFEDILRRQPKNLLALRQVGSLYVTLDRPAEALERFRAAHAVAPSDSLQLQIAYLLNSTGRIAESYEAFSSLRGSNDPAIRQAARRGVDVLTPMLGELSYPWWSRVYASPYYDTRFRNFIFHASLYGGYHLFRGREISLYATAAVTRDSRSTGGTAPVIYSDNFVLGGGGLRFQPFTGFVADLQAGIAFDVVDRPGSPSPRSDFRAVASYGNGWFPAVDVPERFRMTFKPFAELYASFGGYSRYKNGIGYLQTRAGARVIEVAHSALDLYLRGDAAVDTRRDYYNNIVEASLGIRLVPDHRWGVHLLTEIHKGSYAGNSSLPPGISRSYESVRFYLIVDRFFRL